MSKRCNHLVRWLIVTFGALALIVALSVALFASGVVSVIPHRTASPQNVGSVSTDYIEWWDIHVDTSQLCRWWPQYCSNRTNG